MDGFVEMEKEKMYKWGCLNTESDGDVLVKDLSAESIVKKSASSIRNRDMGNMMGFEEVVAKIC